MSPLVLTRSHKKNRFLRATFSKLPIFVIGGFFMLFSFSAQAVTGDYNKPVNGTLAASEWNNLINDFVAKSGARLDGLFSINTATSSSYALDINGALRATSITGALSGTLNAANVSAGVFGSNTGGGNYNFLGNLGIGIGTSTPNSAITLGNNRWISALNSAGTGYVNMFRVNANDEIEVGGALNIGQFQFPADSGFNTFVDMPVTNSSASGTIMGYTMKVDGDNILNVYSESNGAGGVQNRRIGIGTSTPRFTLDVAGIINASALYVNGSPYIGSQWTTQGTSIYYNTGNVGIGITNPGVKLHVLGTGAGDATWNQGIVIENNNATAGESALSFKNTAGGANYWITGMNQGDGYSIAYGGGFTDTLTKFRINPNGYVGISTTTPASMLDVNGLIKMRSSTITANEDVINKGYLDSALASSSATIITQIATSSLWQGSLTGNIWSNNTGNVGIGTTTPLAKMHSFTPIGGPVPIRGSRDNDAGMVMLLERTVGATGAFAVDFNGGYTNFRSVRDLIFNYGASSGGTEAMRILSSSGNVGIGITNPGSYKLNVAGNSYIGGSLTASSSITVSNGDISVTRSGSYANFNNFTYSDVAWQGPRIGFNRYRGTASAPTTAVNGDTAGWFDFFAYDGAAAQRVGMFGMYIDGSVSSGIAPGRFIISTTNSSGASINRLIAYSNDNIVMATNGGNVGIGTTTPGSRLSVSGGNVFINDAVITSGTPKAAITKEYLDSSLTAFNSENNLWKLDGSNVYSSSTAWNVGIGTTNPTQKLSLVGGNIVIGNGNYYMGKTSGGTDINLFGVQTGSSNLQFGSGSINDINFDFGGAGSRVVFKASGNVGIGTTTPNHRLDVDGIARINGINVGGYSTAGSNKYISTEGDSLYFLTDAGSALPIYANSLSLTSSSFASNPPPANGLYVQGSVGIGTSTPLSKLHIEDVNRTIDSLGNVYVSTSDAPAIDRGGQITLGGKWATGLGPTRFAAIAGKKENSSDGNAAGYLGLYTAISTGGTLTEKMRISSSGNVGIGTSTPAARVVVTGGNIFVQDAVITSATPKAVITKEYLDSSLTAFNNENNLWKLNGNNLYSSSTAWNIGIGVTNPTQKLDVSGNVLATNHYAPSLEGFKMNGSLSNVVITTDTTQVAQTPIAGFLWHDLLAFSRTGTPVFEISADGSTWSPATLDNRLFSQREAQSITVMDASVTKAVRWTWSSGINCSLAQWLVLAYAYSSPAVNQTVSIDTSTDGSNWSNKHLSTFTGNFKPYWLALNPPESCSGNYFRVTITSNSSSGLMNMSSMRLLTARWGDQGGGSEYSYPYNWDADRNIFFDNKVGIGTGNPRAKLHIVGGGATGAAAPLDTTDHLVLDDDSNAYINLRTQASGFGGILFSDDTRAAGYIQYDHASDAMKFVVATGADLVVGPTGNVGIGTSSPETRLSVIGSGNYSIDAGNYRIGNVAAPVGVNDAVTKSYMDSAINSATSSITLWGGDTTGNIWNLNSGFVGIGTTNPSKKLHVVGTGSESLMQIGSYFSMRADGVLEWGASLSNGLLSWDAGKVMIGGKSGSDYALLAGGAERARIAAGGNLGIGTTNPLQKLHIKSSDVNTPIRLRLESGQSWDIISNSVAADTYGPANGLTIRNSSVGFNALSINDTGDIGISTTTPGSRLSISGGNAFINDAVITSGTPKAAITKEYLDSSLTAFNTENNLWRLDGSNLYSSSTAWNVGIGVTNPSNKLTIYYDSADYNQVINNIGAVKLIQQDNNGNHVGISFTNEINTFGSFIGAVQRSSTTRDIVFQGYTGSSYAEYLRISASGNVGIGTTNPASALQVNGTISSQALTGNTNTILSVLNNSGIQRFKLDYQVSGPTQLRLSRNDDQNLMTWDYSVGNVGIGTTNPDAMLDVGGGSSAISGITRRAVITANSNSIQALQLQNLSTGSAAEMRFVAAADATNYLAFTTPSSGNTGSFFGLAKSSGSFIFTNNRLLAIGTNDATDLVFGTNNTERMRVLSSGNVGIGTTAPNARLAVSGGNAFINDAVITSATPKAAITKEYLDSSLTAFNDTTNLWKLDGNNLFASSTNWNVGVGVTNPAEKVEIAGGNLKVWDETTLGPNLVDGWVNNPTYPYETLNTSGLEIISAVNSDTYGFAYDSFIAKAGKMYKITYDLTRNSGALPYIVVSQSTTLTRYHFIEPSLEGSNTFYFYGADNITLYIGFYTATGVATDFSVQNFSFNEINSGTISARNVVAENIVANGVISGTGGSGIKIDTNGRVGIGTTIPSTMLHIGNDLVNPTILMDSTGTGDNNTEQSAGLEFGESTSARGSIWYTGDGMIHLGSNNRTREHIRYQFSTTTTWIYGNLYLNGSGNNTYFPGSGIWNSAGNVGIGTTAPGKTLDIQKSSPSSDVALRIANTASSVGDTASIYFQMSGTLTNDFGPRIVASRQGSNAMSDLAFWTTNSGGNSLERMRLLNNGYIAIGTTTSLAALGIDGGNVFINDATITSGTPKAAVTKEYLDSSLSAFNTQNIFWKLNGSDLYASSTDWKVGIGTSDPVAKLEVVDSLSHISGDLGPNDAVLRLYNKYNSDVAGKGAVITFEDNYLGTNRTTRAAIKGGTATAGNTADGFLAFYTDAAGGNSMQERMRINQFGYVGIGTTNPTFPLEVVGAIRLSNPAQLTISDTAYVKPEGAFIDSDTTRALRIGILDNSVMPVGINFFETNNDYTASYINFKAGNADVLRINSLGNVGIGTTTLASRLELSGGNLFIHDSAITSATPKAAITKEYLDSSLSAFNSENNLWKLNGNNLYSSSSAWNVGIGTSDPGAGFVVKNGLSQFFGSTLPTSGTGVEVGYDGAGSYGIIRSVNRDSAGLRNLRISTAGLSIYTGSTTSLTETGVFAIDSVGNVGISTMSPNVRLDVNGALRTNNSVTFSMLSGGGNRVTAVDNNGVLGGGNIYLNGGNVGIGHSNPSSKLHVLGSAVANFDKDDYSTTIIEDADGRMEFVSSDSGSNGAAFILTDAVAAGDNRKWFFGAGTSANGNRLHIGYSTNLSDVNPAANNQFVMLPSGNLGIGTTDPGAYKLYVNGNTNIAGSLNVTGTTTASAFIGPLTGTMSAANVSSGAFGANTGGGNYSFPGNVAIGTSTAENSEGWDKVLNIHGGSHSKIIATTNAIQTGLWSHGTGYYGSPAGGMVGTRSSHPLSLITASTARMTINSSGNVGIGTTNPGAKFTLNGVSGSLFRYEVSSANANQVQGTWDFYTNTAATPDFFGKIGFKFEGGVADANKQFQLHIADSSTPKLVVTGGGNVGIGTTDPGAYRLKVSGDVAITGTLQTQTGSDFAEEFSVKEELEPGTVVVMDDNGHKSVKPCYGEYDKKVVGIVSDNPSIIAGKVESGKKAVVAMMGVVTVKASSINGSIEKGDLITTSDIPGYAMKAESFRPGTIIGKALEDLSGRKGAIKVLVNLQ